MARSDISKLILGAKSVKVMTAVAIDEDRMKEKWIARMSQCFAAMFLRAL